MTPFYRTFTPLLALGLMAACQSGGVTRSEGAPTGDEIAPLAQPAVVDSALGTCFARATTPAIIETVTEQIMIQPASVRSDGTVDSQAIFRTVTRQRILRERREVEFETPCAPVMTQPFIASVQRALLARGYYRGRITGLYDARTRDAVQRFQTDAGDVPTAQLTLQSARALGLVALPREDI